MENIALAVLDCAKKAKNIVITAHKSPDGDSIGSSLGLYHFFKKIGLNAHVCHPDKAPAFLEWIDGASEIWDFETKPTQVNQFLEQADCIFCLDYNEPYRTNQEMGDRIKASSATKIMLDHHLNPAEFCDITWSDTSACSTSQLVLELIENSGNKAVLDEQIGTPLYVGIMTDTGSFRFNSVKPKTHRLVADLLEAGVKNDLIHEQVFDVNTLNRLKLRGHITSENLVYLPELKTAYMYVSEQELSSLNYQKGDTEGLVNVALSIVGVKIAAFFSEKEGEVKISFRSKGSDYPVNVFASTHFNGGGHANASGGKLEGSLENAIHLFLEKLPAYVK